MSNVIQLNQVKKLSPKEEGEAQARLLAKNIDKLTSQIQEIQNHLLDQDRIYREEFRASRLGIAVDSKIDPIKNKAKIREMNSLVAQRIRLHTIARDLARDLIAREKVESIASGPVEELRNAACNQLAKNFEMKNQPHSTPVIDLE